MKRIFLLLIIITASIIPQLLFAEIDTLWTTKIGGLHPYRFYSVVEATDGGYIAAGRATLEETSDDCIFYKSNSDGDSLWEVYYGGAGLDEAKYIDRLNDTTLFMIGNTSSFGMGSFDMWLLKIDGDGDTLWARTYGDSLTDFAESGVPTDDGGFIMVGYSDSEHNGDRDYCVVKTDSMGNMEWVHTYGGAGEEIGHSIVETDDGGYLVVGYGDYASILLVDSLGNEITHINDGNEYYSVTKSTGGNYVATGDWYDGYGSFYLYLKKMDADLNTIITKSYGNSGDWSIGYSIDKTSDGGYIVGGCTGYWFYPDGYILKLDENLGLEWSRVYDVPNTEIEIFSIHEISDGGYIACGGNYPYAWLLKLGEVQDVVEGDSTNIPNNYITLTSYPNPFNTSTEIRYYLPEQAEIKLEVFNLLGRRVDVLYKGKQTKGYHSINWDAADYPSGIYFCKLISGGRSVIKKMILLK